MSHPSQIQTTDRYIHSPNAQKWIRILLSERKERELCESKIWLRILQLPRFFIYPFLSINSIVTGGYFLTIQIPLNGWRSLWDVSSCCHWVMEWWVDFFFIVIFTSIFTFFPISSSCNQKKVKFFPIVERKRLTYTVTLINSGFLKVCFIEMLIRELLGSAKLNWPFYCGIS